MTDSVSIPTFAAPPFNLESSWLAELQKQGIDEPTCIQRAAFLTLFDGKSAFLKSDTGSGKTLAFLLPLLKRLVERPRFRVIIVAPSPELAVQLLRTAEKLLPASVGRVALIGGASMERQRERLKKFPQLMVATPGRLCEFIELKKVRLPTISAFVFDEANIVFDAPAGRRLLEYLVNTAYEGQILGVAANFSQQDKQMIESKLGKVFPLIETNTNVLSEKIEHLLFRYDRAHKDVDLLRLIKILKIPQALIFVNKVSHVPHLFRLLNEAGLATGSISSLGTRQTREAGLQSFLRRKSRFLVATDTAAQGIDIPQLEWVIQYEMARTHDLYLHRAGRTARGAGTGKTLILTHDSESHLARDYAEKLKISFRTLARNAREPT